jgi:hypothetical protein
LHGRIAAQKHFLLITPFHPLADQLLKVFGSNVVLPYEHAAAGVIVGRHRYFDPLAGDLRGAPRLRQLDVDAALQHRRGDHEDDEQHEHDVDQRHDVDLGERRGDTAAAARSPGRSAG